MHPFFPCCLFYPLHTEELFVLLPSCWMWVISFLASLISSLIYLNRMMDMGQSDCRPSLSCKRCSSRAHIWRTMGGNCLVAIGSFWFKFTYGDWDTTFTNIFFPFGKSLFSSVWFRFVFNCLQRWMHWTFRTALWSLTDSFRKVGKNKLSNSACQLLQSLSESRGSCPVNPTSAPEHLSFHILAGSFVDVDHLREGFLFLFQVSFPAPPLLQLFPLRLVMEKFASRS